MTMLLGKRSDKPVTSRGPRLVPADDDFIRTLDYEDLEQRFHIRKYYPLFIHNYDYLTPQIREMIRDKPIYAKANEHVKNVKGATLRKTYVTEIDVETGQIRVQEKKTAEQAKSEKKEAKKKKKEERKERKEEHKERKEERKEEKREERRERKEERKELKEERKEERRERREEKKELKEERKEEKMEEKRERQNARKEVIENRREEHRDKQRIDELDELRKLLREHRSQRMAEKTPQPYFAPAIKPPPQTHLRQSQMEFNNPFDSKQPTLVASAHHAEGVRSRQNSVRTVESMDTLKSSIGGKLRSIMRPRRSIDKSDNRLVRTSSYDQTQSVMTSTRGAKNKLLRLKDDNGRRMSGQIGTYF